ncbi:MAG: prepilin peptidase [Alphaproteobacteria bacterium]
MRWPAVVGAVVGSFLTLITYRLPRDEPVVVARSRCPYCSESLRPSDMVPVLSFAALRGRCRACRAALPGATR